MQILRKIQTFVRGTLDQAAAVIPEIITHFKAKLLSIARAILPQKPDAHDEILQDASSTAVIKRDELLRDVASGGWDETVDGFRMWLSQIVRNLCNTWRRDWPYEAESLDAAEGRDASASEAQVRSSWKELLDDLARARPQSAKILEMLLDGISPKQICKALDVRQSTLMKMRSIAKRDLMELSSSR
jgi:DNA-directed RNA polymerase specialized sigma24 family protein